MATNKLKFGTETPSKLYMGDTEVTKAYMGETLVYEKSSSSGETWLLNENPNASTLPNTSINFTSNEMSFSSIHYVSSEDNPATILYGDTHAWSMGVWINEAFRTITFATLPTGELLTWLQANGVKQ